MKGLPHAARGFAGDDLKSGINKTEASAPENKKYVRKRR